MATHTYTHSHIACTLLVALPGVAGRFGDQLTISPATRSQAGASEKSIVSSCVAHRGMFGPSICTAANLQNKASKKRLKWRKRRLGLEILTHKNSQGRNSTAFPMFDERAIERCAPTRATRTPEIAGFQPALCRIRNETMLGAGFTP